MCSESSFQGFLFILIITITANGIAKGEKVVKEEQQKEFEQSGKHQTHCLSEIVDHTLQFHKILVISWIFENMYNFPCLVHVRGQRTRVPVESR